jgi:DNA modification methylase
MKNEMSKATLKEQRTIGNCTLYLADCLDVFPQIAADLVLTDPSYGLNADKGTNGFGASPVRRYQGNWDQRIPDRKYFDAIRACSKHQIIFGGNYFTEYLPPTKSWILWDKVGEYRFKNPFSDAEMAWTSLNIPTRKITVVQQGFIAEEKERYHPTQKPVKLLTQILSDYSRESDLVFDPYMGSGSVGVACVRLQRRFVGVEIDAHYFEIACQRIAEAVNDQQNMFPCFVQQEAQQRLALESP